MAREIERKFLVDGDFRREVTESIRIVQGYLNSAHERTVRVRIKGNRGYITIKGPSGANGMSRFEWEKEIPLQDAEELMKLCEPGIIDKVRHLVKAGRHVYEIDEFYGCNSGLVVAEIELSDENEEFEKPSWLGPEVTGDPRYYNSSLMKFPYKEW